MVVMMPMVMMMMMMVVMMMVPVAARGRFAGGEYHHAKHRGANEDQFVHLDRPSYMRC
jgi:hypothetical protein